MTKKKNPEDLKRYQEGYIITRPNGTQWMPIEQNKSIWKRNKKLKKHLVNALLSSKC